MIEAREVGGAGGERRRGNAALDRRRAARKQGPPPPAADHGSAPAAAPLRPPVPTKASRKYISDIASESESAKENKLCRPPPLAISDSEDSEAPSPAPAAARKRKQHRKKTAASSCEEAQSARRPRSPLRDDSNATAAGERRFPGRRTNNSLGSLTEPLSVLGEPEAGEAPASSGAATPPAATGKIRSSAR